MDMNNWCQALAQRQRNKRISIAYFNSFVLLLIALVNKTGLVTHAHTQKNLLINVNAVTCVLLDTLDGKWKGNLVIKTQAVSFNSRRNYSAILSETGRKKLEIKAERLTLTFHHFKLLQHRAKTLTQIPPWFNYLWAGLNDYRPANTENGGGGLYDNKINK